MEISKSLEEYIKTMYVLQKQKGIIRVTDIAQKMKCTKASVNKAIKQLKEKGIHPGLAVVIVGEITKDGVKLAKKVLEAYDIVYLFLTELLGIEKKEANLEAEKMKQSMEDATLNKLAKYVQNQLGIQTLECNYDINNEKCIECSRRIKANQN